jgi:hypothetical protein
LNDGLFATILRAIVAALGPYLYEYQVIFMFDAARIHCTSGVFETCFRLGAWPLLISARMTWLLQMLDTHGFAAYKGMLVGEYQDALALGDVDIDTLLQCVYRTIEETIQSKDWGAAFDANGFGADQGALRASVRRHLELEGAVVVSSERPGADDVRPCFPRRSVVHPRVLSRMALPAPPALPAPAAAVLAPLPAVAGPVTRSMAAAAAAAAVAPAPVPVVVAHRLLPRRYCPPA